MDGKKNEKTDPDVHRTTAGDQNDTEQTDERATDMRKANENIRKSQGEDAGPPPVIDRHR